MLKYKSNILLSALCFLIVLIGNFILFRQNFIQMTAGSNAIYLIFGAESILLLIAIFRFPSPKIKLVALSGLIACIIGFIFELLFFVNGIGIFNLHVGWH